MADSFNELHGLGSHAKDSAMKWWGRLQDNAASTVVVDDSGNGINGVLVGGSNTSDLAEAGPTSWQPSAIRFAPSDYITQALSALGGDDATILMTLKADSNVGVGEGWCHFGESNTGSSSHYLHASEFYCSALRGTSSSATSRINFNPVPDVTSWRNLAIKTTPGLAGFRVRMDGSTEYNTTGITGLYTGGSWCLGKSAAAIFFEGAMAGVSIWSRALTNAEEAMAFAGPNPVNSVAPTLSIASSSWSGTVGTWALPSPFSLVSNGTITYTWELRDADDDSVVDSGSGSSPSGTGSYSGEHYLRVAASNTGGNDSAADTNSANASPPLNIGKWSSGDSYSPGFQSGQVIP